MNIAQPRLLGHDDLSVVGLAIATIVMMQHRHDRRERHPAWVWFFGAAWSASRPASPSSTSPSTTRPAPGGRSRRSPRPRKTGPATNIISGIAVGFETHLRHRDHDRASRCSSATASATQARHHDADGRNVGGIFGTAVATMGMLMTTAYILAMDTFGPITDNAGGIAEMSDARGGAREITDRLDAVGNTTKALTKGYAIALGGAGRVPALQRLHRQGQPDHPRQIEAGTRRRQAC